MVMEDPDNASLDDDGNDGASSCSDMGHDDVLPESIEADEEIRLHILGLSSYYTSVIECNFGAKISLLPTRYLPPGSIRLLYLAVQGGWLWLQLPPFLESIQRRVAQRAAISVAQQPRSMRRLCRLQRILWPICTS